METQDHVIIPKRKHSVIVISPTVSFDDDHVFLVNFSYRFSYFDG